MKIQTNSINLPSAEIAQRDGKGSKYLTFNMHKESVIVQTKQSWILIFPW